MDIKSLKDKILQLAIQGKLVPQDENDESASVLLEKIKSEKEQLIKDKVIKKEKPLPKISEEEKSFDLPKGWEWCKLGTITINHDSKRKPVSVKDRENLEKIYDYYGATGVIDKVDNYIFDGFYLLIGEDGGNFFTDKDVAFTVTGKFWPNNHVHVLECIDNITTDYLKLFLNSIDFKKLDLITGIAVPKLNQLNLNNIVISLPPLEEQKRIVAKVDELFELIDELDNNKQELLENISNTRNKVLQLAIQGKLVEQCEDDEPASVLLERIKAEKEQLIKDKVIKKEKPLPEISEEEKLFDIPKSWQWVRLGEVTNYGKNKSIQGNLIDDNTWVLELEDIERDTSKIIQKIYYKDRKSKSNKLVFEIGDVLYSKLRPYLNKIVLAEDSGVCSSEIMPIKSYGNYIYPKYLLYSMKSKSFITYVNNITYGTKMPRLNTEDGRKILIPLPPLEEQKRIVAKVDLIMDYLGKLQQEVESQEIILKDIIQ